MAGIALQADASQEKVRYVTAARSERHKAPGMLNNLVLFGRFDHQPGSDHRPQQLLRGYRSRASKYKVPFFDPVGHRHISVCLLAILVNDGDGKRKSYRWGLMQRFAGGGRRGKGRTRWLACVLD